MKTLIYQCWTGRIRPGCLASQANISQYAQRIGAQYWFSKDPNIAGRLCDVPIYFEWLNPLLDESFLDFDAVLSVDMDVFAVDGLQQSIFTEAIGDVALCTEPFQPEYRATGTGPICAEQDEKWARAVAKEWHVEMPRDERGRLKVYNAGVVVFSKGGLLKCRERFVPFQQYIDLMRAAGLPRFYSLDQNYFHAMLKVAALDYVELANSWNSYIHYTGSPDIQPRPVHDSRRPDSRFVHIQLRGADDFDAAKLGRITNLDQANWG